ncbi:MAG: type II secretion system F family protein [Elusimicrobiaceae bacterium]|nr:type II secretion system F family protein [Elusimicrobiaceae bacterium]
MRNLKLIVLFVFALFVGHSVCFAQQVLTPKQTDFLKCAREKNYAVYNFFNVEKSAEQRAFMPSACGKVKNPIPMPKWLDESLPAMSKNITWQQNTKSGVQYFSEAQMWQKAFAMVQKYLDLAENINEGTAFTSQEIMEQFSAIRTDFLVILDIIATEPDFYESMDGRGRQLIGTLELIRDEMVSVGESFVIAQKLWQKRFRKSIMGISVLSNSMYSTIMMKQPLAVAPNHFEKPKNEYFIIFLTMVGTLLVFVTVLMFMTNQNEAINNAIDRYLQKTAIWVDDYNRQFIRINIKYLVVGTVLGFTMLGAFLLFAVGGLMGFIFLVIFFILGLNFGLKMPGILLNTLKKRRGQKINKQLMDALILLSNSLKSGMDIVQGFEMVSKDLRPPISEEFALVIKNYSLGTPFERALEMMEERVDSRLLSYMVKAIVLQRQVGGNLTKIFERIVENIREESKLEEKLQAMTAQQRIQSIVVAVMPWIMVSVMVMFQPDTMISFYTQPVGLIVLVFCIFWIGIGMKAVSKLGEIKV